ncbi:MAG: hypothetical protein JWO10_88, partial [Microbacteriaceae bacterium]|nr:hypothetical protein [Microbacteriaceae bacterium]
RSYTGGRMRGNTTSWAYDCALTVLAFLASGTPAHQERAEAIGAVLLALQEPDGRFRTAYVADSHEVAAEATATGNQAWVGVALLALGERTAAERAATWIAETQSTDLGFTGGVAANGTAMRWKSTEHNADAVALFGSLGWSEQADSARRLLAAMFDGERSATGTLEDGVTPNLRPAPLDAQVWPYLATGESGAAVEWAASALSVDGGVSFSDADRSAVWLEGTAQLAVARQEMGLDADMLLQRIWLAQRAGVNTDGFGVIAASRDGLRTGFGDSLFASLHTGTTAWAVFAGLGVNPLAALAPAATR